MLPQLLPHKDKEYLLAFGSDNCDHCDQMEPVLKRLEEDLGNHIFYSIQCNRHFHSHFYIYKFRNQNSKNKYIFAQRYLLFTRVNWL